MRKILTFFMMAALMLMAGSAWAQDQQPQTSQAAAPASETVVISPVEAFNLILAEAEKGDLDAMLTAGTFYEQGVGIPRHFGKALEWYKKAAEAGSAPAMYNVGVCYEIGMGAAPSLNDAFSWYNKAGDKKLPQALHKLAGLYLEGLGVKQDQAKAVEYMVKAVENGHPIAANELGIIYLNGLWGQKKDGAKALDTFVKAAELGNIEAMKNLAVIFKDGLADQKIDAGKALKWYLVTQASGYPANDLPDIISSLSKDMKPEQIKASENEANTWLKARPWNQAPAPAAQK